MTKNTITIAQESQGPKASGGAGERLDQYLVKSLPDLSRTKIQKMIEAGQVFINDKKPAKHQFLKTNDRIEIRNKKLEIEGLEIKTKKKARAGVMKGDFSLWKLIKIINDTPDYLVIEKPAGLLVHPTDRGETNTLIDWVVSQYPELKNIGEDPRRAAIVHRLDKEVSGLMVIPKTQVAFEYFKKLFKLRQIEKRYAALVYGEVKSDAGEVNFPIGRSKDSEGLFAATPVESGIGKPAKTKFWVKTRYKNFTLLEVEIMTGRTHQIRVHMKALGHPIVGDELYKIRGLRKKMDASRIFLHAASLSFTDLKGKEKKYEAKLPNELKEILSRVK
ncbi:MAG: RluA family pseudouridine synthase [Candidatus Buchananbacteria bacterium]|jgi:23S rRNA pseudouridine1911/1915/1917 synthase